MFKLYFVVLMRTEIIILILAILFTGLMAGVFFTWSNAVKPGIGKLSDIEYLRAFQSMNRVILNNTFKLLFIGAVLATALVPFFYFHLYPSNIFWLLVSAFIVYWVGAFGTTVFGNIPLNEILDKTTLETLSLEELKSLRTSIELRWNNLNLLRTISSLLTFSLLVFSYTLMNR